MFYLYLHSFFARLTPELRLAGQSKANMAENRILFPSGEGCPPYFGVSRTSADLMFYLYLHSFFARLTPELRLAGQPKANMAENRILFPSGEGCPP